MTPVGETLRRERVKRNLEIEEISKELKISARFLQAIEDDRFESLPGGVFAKSFVRQYARFLGLDEQQIAGQVQQTLSPLPEPSQLPERSKPAGFAPLDIPRVDDEWQTVGDRGFHWSGWLSAVVFVAVMLVCSAIYTWIQRPKYASSRPSASGAPSQATQAQNAPAPQPPVETSPPPPPAEPQATSPVEGQSANGSPVAGQLGAAPAGQLPAPPSSVPTAESRPAEPRPETPKAAETKPAPPGTVEPKPVAPKPAETRAADTPALPLTGGGAVRVTVTADEAVWLLARADGKYAFSATLDPHTTRTVEAAREVTLRLGNAGGVTITLNGKSIGPAGPKGQVRTLQFTSGGFQIVPAKPSVPVPPPAAARL